MPENRKKYDQEFRAGAVRIVAVALPPFRGHGLCGFLRIRDLE